MCKPSENELILEYLEQNQEDHEKAVTVAISLETKRRLVIAPRGDLGSGSVSPCTSLTPKRLGLREAGLILILAADLDLWPNQELFTN